MSGHQTLKFEQLLKKRFHGTANRDDYVHWAETELLDGKDSPHLRIVAGLLNADDLEHHFLAALQELNLSLPPREDYFQDQIRQILQAVVQQQIETGAAFFELEQIDKALNHPLCLAWLRELDADYTCAGDVTG